MASRPARTEDPVARTRRRLAHLLALGALRAAVAASKEPERPHDRDDEKTPGQKSGIT